LLHIGFEDLETFGVPDAARAALRGLLADLPLVPDASFSAQLVGPASVTLPALAVLARHVGQGLRDTNLTIAHDKERLRTARLKLAFLRAANIAPLASQHDERPQTEAALFLYDLETPREDVLRTLRARDTAGLASFVTSTQAVPELANWRVVDLG
jgi:hypothetical protein